MWERRPKVTVGDRDVPWLRTVLDQCWVQGQVDYHKRKAHVYRTNFDRVTFVLLVLFISTIVAAIGHTFELGGRDSLWVHAATAFSILLPAAGGALAGIREVREYLRHSERYKRVATQMGELGIELRNSKDLRELRGAAVRAETALASENREWFGLMRLHEVEPHF